MKQYFCIQCQRMHNDKQGEFKLHIKMAKRVMDTKEADDDRMY